jgi:hypothetical protein
MLLNFFFFLIKGCETYWQILPSDIGCIPDTIPLPLLLARDCPDDTYLHSGFCGNSLPPHIVKDASCGFSLTTVQSSLSLSAETPPFLSEFLNNIKWPGIT